MKRLTNPWKAPTLVTVHASSIEQIEDLKTTTPRKKNLPPARNSILFLPHQWSSRFTMIAWLWCYSVPWYTIRSVIGQSELLLSLQALLFWMAIEECRGWDELHMRVRSSPIYVINKKRKEMLWISIMKKRSISIFLDQDIWHLINIIFY